MLAGILAFNTCALRSGSIFPTSLGQVAEDGIRTACCSDIRTTDNWSTTSWPPGLITRPGSFGASTPPVSVPAGFLKSGRARMRLLLRSTVAVSSGAV